MAPLSNEAKAQLEVELIKRDIVTLTHLCEKIDRTIDKLEDVSVTLSRMVSLQEQRLETQEKATKELKSEFIAETRDIHKRINDVQKDLVERIDDIEVRILDEIQKLRVELSRMEPSPSTDVSNRLSDIEKWRWVLTGGALVVGWLLSHIFDIINFFPPGD